MGLSTKQVSSDHHLLDWNQTLLESGKVELPKPPPTRRQQQNQQHSEPLKCPRCSSTNTKFCYYNNYNKSQPRHFCKACKRHWTKGGTLRNVPIGGGRKNKRLKTANAATTTTATTSIASGSSGRNYGNLAHSQQVCHNSPLASLDHQKNISDILYKALISSSSSGQHDSINAFTSKTSMRNKNSFTASPMLSWPQDHQNLQFSLSSLSPFDTIPCSFPSSNLSLSNGYDYTGELDHVESSTITTVNPTTSAGVFSESWHGPTATTTSTTSSVMAEMPNYWNWNDMDPLISSDLNISWMI